MSLDDEATRISGTGIRTGEPLNPGLMLRRYRVVRLLGRGGMGEVYEVEHTVLEKRYALKLIHASLAVRGDFRERFRREARIMAGLSHPGIVAVDEYGEWDGRPWLRMDLIQGIDTPAGHAVSLKELADLRGGKLDERELRDILQSVLEALYYAHQKGIIHRDLKPANILLTERGPKIADFGLVQVMGEERLVEAIEETLALDGDLNREATLMGAGEGSTMEDRPMHQALLGTYDYMSPEQKAGSVVTPSSDLYALGQMAFRLLTGEGNPGLRAPSELVGGIDRGWDAFLTKALESRPQRRFQSAHQMRRSLPSLVENKKHQRRTGIRKSRKTLIALFAMLIILALLAANLEMILNHLITQPPDGPLVEEKQTAEIELPQNREPRLLELGGIVDMEMKWIPAGSFRMGAKTDGEETSNLLHNVVITEGFWMSDIEVTRENYYVLMQRLPQSEDSSPFVPVTGISWSEAMEFCKQLTAREQSTNRLPEDYIYRLPTEAEWEYACRGGTHTAYFFGSNLELLPQYAHYNTNSPEVVGLHKPNPFGLYDILGNAWEWCHDIYSDVESGSKPLRMDPAGPGEGEYRVVRGGSFYDTGVDLRSATRGLSLPDGGEHIGFRIVLAKPIEKASEPRREDNVNVRGRETLRAP